MMIKTRHFGEINIDEEKVINFRDGIPGFTDIKRYVLLTNEDNKDNGPFFWLQAVDDSDVAFAVVNPFAFDTEYSPEIQEEYVDFLGHEKPEDLTVLNVVVVPEDIKDMTVNLKAPILINQKTKLGAQVISNNQEYEVRHYIYNNLKTTKKETEEGVK